MYKGPTTDYIKWDSYLGQSIHWVVVNTTSPGPITFNPMLVWGSDQRSRLVGIFGTNIINFIYRKWSWGKIRKMADIWYTDIV